MKNRFDNDNKNFGSPIILIGMHRSGTTLITNMLSEMGLFIGKRLDVNHEPLFFANLNNWLFRQCGAEWDNPFPTQKLYEFPQALALTSRKAHCLLESPRGVFFLGLTRYLRIRSLFKQDTPWGWKDPRNTFTLPIWRDLFPNAKVIHVYRHGVDVAASLKVRAEKILSESYVGNSCDDWRRIRPHAITNSIRCLTLEGGFSLWEEYMAVARQHLISVEPQAIEIKYESFLEDPIPILKKLAAFTELKFDSGKVHKLTKNIQRERAYGFREKSDLYKFANTVHARLEPYGYKL